jgi:hypothetical protein
MQMSPLSALVLNAAGYGDVFIGRDAFHSSFGGNGIQISQITPAAVDPTANCKCEYDGTVCSCFDITCDKCGSPPWACACALPTSPGSALASPVACLKSHDGNSTPLYFSSPMYSPISPVESTPSPASEASAQFHTEHAGVTPARVALHVESFADLMCGHCQDWNAGCEHCFSGQGPHSNISYNTTQDGSGALTPPRSPAPSCALALENEFNAIVNEFDDIRYEDVVDDTPSPPPAPASPSVSDRLGATPAPSPAPYFSDVGTPVRPSPVNTPNRVVSATKAGNGVSFDSPAASHVMVCIAPGCSRNANLEAFWHPLNSLVCSLECYSAAGCAAPPPVGSPRATTPDSPPSSSPPNDTAPAAHLVGCMASIFDTSTPDKPVTGVFVPHRDAPRDVLGRVTELEFMSSSTNTELTPTADHDSQSHGSEFSFSPVSVNCAQRAATTFVPDSTEHTPI